MILVNFPMVIPLQSKNLWVPDFEVLEFPSLHHIFLRSPDVRRTLDIRDHDV